MVFRFRLFIDFKDEKGYFYKNVFIIFIFYFFSEEDEYVIKIFLFLFVGS